jgi:dTDP-4-dehydrorhamnose reductase
MRVLVTGASGGLGADVLIALMARGVDVVAWSGRRLENRGRLRLTPVDFTDPMILNQKLDEANPEAVVHLAAISSAAEARNDPDLTRRVNVEATETIARWCASHERRLIFTSTDMVFDGGGSWFREQDEPRPISTYGRSKLEAENYVRKDPRGLVARVALLYGFSKSGRPAFFDRAIEDLRSGKPRAFFEDEFRTPLSLEDAATILARLTEIEISGTLHVAGRERVSRFELMRRASIALGFDASLVRANRREEVVTAEPRAADLSLDTTKLAAVWPDCPRRSIENVLSDRSFAPIIDSIQ